MKSFKTWLENQNHPLFGKKLGISPVHSGIEKLLRGLRAGGPQDGLVGLYVFSSHFGLDQEEVQSLFKLGVIIRDEGVFGINIPKLQSLQTQLSPGQSAKIGTPSPPVPPPVPGTM